MIEGEILVGPGGEAPPTQVAPAGGPWPERGDPGAGGAGAGGPSGTPPLGMIRPLGRRRSWWRIAWRTALGVLLVLVGYYAITFFQVWSTGRADQARKVDAIVVLGAAQYDGRPSPQLQARLDHVVELYQRGLAPVVVVTGGNQPGDRFTEASSSARYLERKGVPKSAILREDTGHSTWESLDHVKAILQPKGLDRVLIVTDPYHSLRSRLIAQELGFTAYTSPTRTSPVRGGRALTREAKEAAGIALGRVIGFERLWKVTG